MSTKVVVINYSDGSLRTVKQEGEFVLEIKIDNRVVYSDPVLQAPVANLGLSERAYHCLRRARIDTVGRLLQRSGDDLLYITNFGPKRLDEVNEKLRKLNLHLSLTDYAGPPTR